MKRGGIPLLILIFISPNLSSETKFYASNVVEMRFDEIGEWERLDYPYFIKEDIEENSTIETFYVEGREKRRVETVQNGKERKEYEDRVLRSHQKFGSDALLEEEILYREDGSMIERQVFSYRGSGSVTVRAFDEDSNFLYEEERNYAVDGSLRGIIRRNAEEVAQALVNVPPPREAEGDAAADEEGAAADPASAPPAVYEQYSRYQYVGDRIVEEEHASGDHVYIITYDFYGRINRTEERIADLETSVHRFEYGDDLNQKTPLSESIEEGERSIIRTYDRGNRLVREEVRDNRLLLLTIENRYDNNRLVSSIRRSTGTKLERALRYNDRQELIAERWILNGVLDRSIEYSSSADSNVTERIETFYRKNVPFARIFYKNNFKFMEEILYNGQVVYSRGFE